MSEAVDWDALADILAARQGVLAAWAFGSVLNDRMNPESDLDIGVLFAAAPSLDEWADLRADLQETVQAYEVDLVTLNRASSTLRFQAISGRRLICRDAEEVAGFVSLTAREYEDDLAFAEKGLRWMLQARA